MTDDGYKNLEYNYDNLELDSNIFNCNYITTENVSVVIARLISIRDYLATVIQDPRMANGDKYLKLGSIKSEIDSTIIDNLLSDSFSEELSHIKVLDNKSKEVKNKK